MKKMIQIIDKMQSKPMPKTQKMAPKDTSEFKDTLNQAVSDQGRPENTNQASNQTNQTQNSDKPKTETGNVNENNISKEELDSVEKSIVDGLTLAVNAFQMEVKPEIKSVQIELPKETEMLKVGTNMAVKNSEEFTSQISSENKSQVITEELLQNNATNVTEKNLETSGKLKLENFESKVEEVSTETVKKPEIKTETSEVKLDSKVNSEEIQKVTSKTTDNQEKPSLETAPKETATVLEPQKQIKPESTEVITVKVGDGQTISSEKLVTEVAKNITIKTDGKNEYELQLDPENLGKIKVKLLFEDGKLSVSLLCNNSKTANLLSEGISNLGQAIQQNTKSEVTVNVSEENYLNDNQSQQNKQNSSNQQHQKDQQKDDTQFEDKMKLGLWEIENLKKQFSADFRIM